MTTTAATPSIDTLAAILRGSDVCPITSASELTELLEACTVEGVTGLVYLRLRQATENEGWPRPFIYNLARAARADDARELLHQREITTVLATLAKAGVRPILLKGTPLAYSVYPTAASRPRVDCDMLIGRDDVPVVRRAMASLGYTTPLQCDGELLFRQFALTRTDALGIDHQFDIHWSISSQSLFGDLLSYEELAREAVDVPTLGPHARTAGAMHALLHACVHPVMHHRNTNRLIWVYDVHLLVARLSDEELDRFTELATRKQVAAIVAHRLMQSRLRFATRIPERVLARLLGPAGEPSASYLRPGRRWHHDLASNLKALSSWRDRSQLIREVIFPSPRYMLETYGMNPGPLGLIVVPALYLHRGTWGLLKILRGRK